jgi:hypothetical protein
MGVRGRGSPSERRPAVFEIRIAVGADPVTGRTIQRSAWFHGALEDVEERRTELASQFAEYRALRRAAPFLTVGNLLARFQGASEGTTWPVLAREASADRYSCDTPSRPRHR